MTKTNNKDEFDWFDELTEEQQQSVMRGLEQAKRGEPFHMKKQLRCSA